MLDFHDYQRQFPLQKKQIQGRPFTYRHYQHATSEETVVLLVGGLGLSDLGFTQVQGLSKDFSVITFDYHQEFPSVHELFEAINALLQELHLQVWFVGQSLGVFFAQLLAEKYPSICRGLVLSNTGCLSKNMSKTAVESLVSMIERSKKTRNYVKLIPFSLFKKLISKKVMKTYGSEFSPEERKILQNFCDIMEDTLEKSYEIHMINLLIQLEGFLDREPDKVAYLDGNVLLMLSEDDQTFHEDVKEALIDFIPHPKVVTDLTGGHLALLVRCEEYVSLISEFILSKSGESTQEERNIL